MSQQNNNQFDNPFLSQNAQGQNPFQQAKGFIQLIEDLGKDKDPNMRKVRNVLMQGVVDFSTTMKSSQNLNEEAANKKLEEASQKLAGTLAGVEHVLSDLLIDQTKAVRDQISATMQELGEEDPKLIVAKKGFEGLEKAIAAMQLMREAMMTEEEEIKNLRQLEAERLMKESRELLGPFQVLQKQR